MFPLKTLAERHNVTPDDKVRPALYSVSTPSSGTVFVGGFSIEAANTGALYHYIVERATATGIGTIYVKNEQFQTISSTTIGYIPKQISLSWACQNRQLIISAPEFSYTLYSIVGGGVVRCIKVASAVPTTTALEVPVGSVCSFGDRVVIAQGSALYFNDPGVDIRTFVAENVVAMPAKITDIFEGPSGALIIGTTMGVYALPSDALGQGQLVFGFMQKLSSYEAQQPRNIAFANGQLLGLQKGGFSTLGDQAVATNPAPYAGKRYISTFVGPGDSGDYRYYQMFGSVDYGHLISAGGSIYSVKQGQWITSGLDLSLVGVLKTDLGATLFMTPTQILDTWGNVEADDSDFIAVACGTIPVNVTDSTMVRAIITSSDNVSHQQKAYIGAQQKTDTTPPPARAENIIGTNHWSVHTHYCAPEIRSRRHHVVLRTDEVTMEVAFDEALSNIGPIDVETKQVGPKRPTN
jgi:hypothetical protein